MRLRVSPTLRIAAGLILAVLLGVVGYHVLHWRIPGSSEALLEQADEKSWVNNWIAAEPIYRQAELGFIRKHELSKALYAHVSEIPAQSESSISVPAQLAELTADLSLPQAQDSIKRAKGTRAKIRNIMSAIFHHAMRYEWVDRNPIKLVRQSAKREKVPEVLELFELQLLLSKLFVRERTLALLDAATGLRVSELLALRWSDVDFENLELNVTRSIWHQVVGNCKTEASAKPVPMDSYMAEDLLRWRRQSDYASDDDYVFASETMKGKQPYWPDNLMKRHIRPVAKANGINKNIGWHTFRHSFGTLLKANGEDVKTVQELLRHANSRITLDVYTQALSTNKRAAQSKVVKMMVPNLGEMKDEKLSQNGR